MSFNLYTSSALQGNRGMILVLMKMLNILAKVSSLMLLPC
jgi:hypothetical protein